jgi:hypothetical protein
LLIASRLALTAALDAFFAAAGICQPATWKTHRRRYGAGWCIGTSPSIDALQSGIDSLRRAVQCTTDFRGPSFQRPTFPGAGSPRQLSSVVRRVVVVSFPLRLRLPSENARQTFVAMVGEFSLFGVREISGLQRKSGYQKRSRAAVTTQRHSMTKFSLLGMVAILSTAIRTPSFAETPIQELVAYASSHQGGNLGIASTPARRREITVVGRGTADVTASKDGHRYRSSVLFWADASAIGCSDYCLRNFPLVIGSRVAI